MQEMSNTMTTCLRRRATKAEKLRTVSTDCLRRRAETAESRLRKIAKKTEIETKEAKSICRKIKVLLRKNMYRSRFNFSDAEEFHDTVSYPTGEDSLLGCLDETLALAQKLADNRSKNSDELKKNEDQLKKNEDQLQQCVESKKQLETELESAKLKCNEIKSALKTVLPEESFSFKRKSTKRKSTKRKSTKRKSSKRDHGKTAKTAKRSRGKTTKRSRGKTTK